MHRTEHWIGVWRAPSKTPSPPFWLCGQKPREPAIGADHLSCFASEGSPNLAISPGERGCLGYPWIIVLPPKTLLLLGGSPQPVTTVQHKRDLPPNNAPLTTNTSLLFP